MSIARDTLQDAGFAENAPSGLFYELGAQGAVRRFGLLRPGADAGEEDGQVVEIAPDGSSATQRSWQQQIFPHPDADPSETLADWCADAQRKMLNTAHHVQVCSFCEKTQSEVRKLIAGPAVMICDECAKLAHEIASQD